MGDKLWIPSTSHFRANKEWKNENFKKNTRYENVAFKADNILTPEGIMHMLKVHQKMVKFRVHDSTFEDLCLRLPVQNLFYSGSRKSVILSTEMERKNKEKIDIKRLDGIDDSDDHY